MLNIADVSKDTPSGEIMSAIINGAVAYVTNIVKGAASHIFSFIVGFILSFYFLLSKNELIAKIKRALIAFLPENAYKRVSHFAKYTNTPSVNIFSVRFATRCLSDALLRLF
jgi:predicted PurR-regulated permease PerM